MKGSPLNRSANNLLPGYSAGMTLVEISLAGLISSLILGIAYGFLIQISRSYQRHDRVVEHSRQVQITFESLRADIDRAMIPLQVDAVPQDGLRAIGFEGTPMNFLTRPRSGGQIINGYKSSTDLHPYLSQRFSYREFWEDCSMEIPRVCLSASKSNYIAEAPPQHIWNSAHAQYIPPWGPDVAIHLGDPPASPTTHYLALGCQEGSSRTAVLWAFRQKPDRAFSVVRWSAPRGTRSFTLDGLESVELSLDNDWAYWDSDPPTRPGPWVLSVKSMITVTFSFDEANKSFSPNEQLRVILGP